MNVGDRVRLLTGTEEGIVTRLLDSELVEVANDNDFTIPVLRREVVVIAADENKNFDRTVPDLGPGQRPGKNNNASKKDKSKALPALANKPAQPSLAEALAAVASSSPAATKAANQGKGPGASAPQPAAKGLFLALVHQSPELLAVTIINNTEAEVLFTYGEETPTRPYRALAAGHIGPRSSSKALAHVHLKDFEQWAAVVVQLLPFRTNGDTAYELVNKRQAFKASTFYSSRKPAPIIQKEAYLFQLDEKPAAPLAPEKLIPEPIIPAMPVVQTGINIEALRAQLTGDAAVKAAPAAAPTVPSAPVVAPSHEFDLHIEALRPNKNEELSNTAALRVQLDAFEDALSRALATNMHEIVFLHGMDNGTLRKEIHRQLSRNKDIKFFEDARKEKFGFRATLVRLK